MLSNIFKQDPLLKETKKTSILQNSLTQKFMDRAMQLYAATIQNNKEQQSLIKLLLKALQEKGSAEKKLKVMAFWVQIYKETKYDLSDILFSKKIKLFTKPSANKLNPKVGKENLEEYIIQELLVPLYNYFMKLSLNEDLYRHCLIGKIPDDELFRRGTKIRFIWIFKIYNLIYILIPIMEACIRVLQKFPHFVAVLEIAHLLYRDMLTMNNFIIEALEEGSQDNYVLMPYFDLLQFHESLAQQPQIIVKINEFYSDLLGFEELKPNKPRMLDIDPDTIADIRVQVTRVKLISFTLKNPKKDYTNLATEYECEVQKEKQRILRTEGDTRDDKLKEFQMRATIFEKDQQQG